MQAVELAVQTGMQSLFGPSMHWFWQAVTLFGDASLIMLLVCMIIWTQDSRSAVRIAMVVLISGIVVGLLKVGLQMPRPYYVYDVVQVWHASSGFGMPSGHAATAMSFFGMVLLRARQRWVVVACFCIILLVGLSRVYLGVHSATQVLAGWMIGMMAIGIFTRFEQRIVAILSTHKPLVKISVAGLLVSMPLVLHIYLGSLVHVPDAWLVKIAQTRLVEQPVATASIMELSVPELTKSGRSVSESDNKTVSADNSLSNAQLEDAFVEPYRVYYYPLLFGFLLVAVQRGIKGGFGGFLVLEKITNVVFGLTMLGTWITLANALPESAAILIILSIALPWLIVIGVPACSIWVSDQTR